MDRISRFYATTTDGGGGSHLALSWKGLVRYTVPQSVGGQMACWELFKPGRLKMALRAQTLLPNFFGAVQCIEGETLLRIRDALGTKFGESCCRAGAPGVWRKDTILLLEEKTQKPQLLVKVGSGSDVKRLLENEATWLRELRLDSSLAEYIPKLMAQGSEAGFSFIGQQAFTGALEFSLQELHLQFLLQLQHSSVRKMTYRDSKFYNSLKSRASDLRMILSAEWNARLELTMRLIENAFNGSKVDLVVAHNDFTPWNVRIHDGSIKVFDWEYAEAGQLALFDPLHFSLAPLAHRGKSSLSIIREARKTIDRCQGFFGRERCFRPMAQAIAYMLGICTLYLSSDGGTSESHPVVKRYAQTIDQLSQDPLISNE